MRMTIGDFLVFKNRICPQEELSKLSDKQTNGLSLLGYP
jgi:hypothetical protein